MNSPEPATAAAADRRNRKRRRGLLLLAVVVLIGGAAWFAWWYAHARWYVSTEDAYAGATVVQVTSEVAGTMRTVHPRETESVTAGQPLIELDPADARIAMDAAARRPRRHRAAGARRLPADGTAAGTDLGARDRPRPRARRPAGAASRSLPVAPSRPKNWRTRAKWSPEPKRRLRSAREDLNVALAQTGGIDASRHPQVMRAIARVREAALALERTRITAPVNGVVARKGVQLGQRVNAGTPLLAVVDARRRVGRRELQGSAAAAHAHRAAGRS